MKKSIFALALAAALVLSFTPVHAQWAGNPPDVQAKVNETINKASEPAELLALANAARQRADFQTLTAAMVRLSALRPQSGDYIFGLATAYALAGKKSETYNNLLKLQKLGLSYPVDGNPDFKLVADTEVYRYIADALKANGNAFGGGKLRLTAQGKPALTESITYDQARQEFLLGDVAQGVVYRIKADGSKRVFITGDAKNGVAGVLGVLVDSKRNALWVASAELPQYARFNPERAGMSSLARFDLASGAFQARLEVPKEAGPRLLSHMAIAADGTLYIADGLNPAVYQVKAGGKTIEPLFSNPILSDLRAIALSPSGRILYVADLQMGLYGVDLVKKAGVTFAPPDTLNLGGITGMTTSADGSLLLVQAGTSPKRIMRLRMKNDGTELDKIEPLDAAQPALENPVGAVLVGKQLVTIANSQWTKFDREGKLLSGQTLDATKLWASDLDFAGVTPSAEQALQEMRRATEARQKKPAQ